MSGVFWVKLAAGALALNTFGIIGNEPVIDFGGVAVPAAAEAAPAPAPAQAPAPGTYTSIHPEEHQYADLFRRTEASTGVPAALLAGVARCESAFDPNADSGQAGGLMQFKYSTADERGINEWDPNQAIPEAGQYFLDARNHLGQDTSWEILIASYNAGYGGAAVEAGRIPQNGQTPGYVSCVTREWAARQ